MNQLSDEQLFKLFQDGDNKAFDKLAIKYQDKLVTFIYMYVGDIDLANDLAQDTYVKVVTKKHKYNEEKGAKFSTWMYTIAKNAAFTELRKRTRRGTDSFSEIKRGEDKVGKPFEIEDPSKSPEDEIMARYKKESIYKALSQLKPKDFRTIIILRDIQELSYDDVSTILEVPIGTVKSRINRAREKFLELLKEKDII